MIDERLAVSVRLQINKRLQTFARGVLDVDSDEAGTVYRHKLVLSRPDQHVAWRGDAIPPDIDRLIAVISGKNTGPADIFLQSTSAGADLQKTS